MTLRLILHKLERMLQSEDQKRFSDGLFVFFCGVFREIDGHQFYFGDFK